MPTAPSRSIARTGGAFCWSIWSAGGPDDVERLVRFRKRYPGVPWIAIAQGAQFPLTTCSLARMHGAEAIFYKPCYDWDSLCEVVQAALARIAHWERAMEEAASLHAA